MINSVVIYICIDIYVCTLVDTYVLYVSAYVCIHALLCIWLSLPDMYVHTASMYVHMCAELLEVLILTIPG